MSIEHYISTGGLLIAALSLTTSYFLQRDARKVRELESQCQKYKNRLIKALYAIKGYQLNEVEHAAKEGVDIKTYRSAIRKDKQELFSTSFLTPARINEMIGDLENE